MAFRYDKFALVLSNKIVFLIFSIYAGFLIYSLYYKISNIEFKSPISLETKWEEYLKNCGAKVILENSVKANLYYEQNYKNNYVRWSGYFIYGFTLQDNSLFRKRDTYNFLIKMEPSESEHYPDIILTMSYDNYQRNQDIIKNLNLGDKISFEASFTKIGDERHFLIMEALNVQKREGESKKFENLIQIDNRAIIDMIMG